MAQLISQLTGHTVTEADMLDRLQYVEGTPGEALYVCCEGERVVGLYGFRIRQNLDDVSCYGEVSVIVVDQTAKRRGVGKRMMEHAEQQAVEQGCKGTWLVSGMGRVNEAHSFYQELGYEVTGYRFVKHSR